MRYKKYTTFPKLWWIIMLTSLATITLGQWDSVFSIVAGIIAVGLVLWAVANYVIHKCQLHRLFEVYPDNPKRDSFRVCTSANPQDIEFTLKMKTSATLQFIAITFEGNGKVPSMESIYNHQLKEPFGDDVQIKAYPPNVEFPNGGFNITYRRQSYRNKGQRTRIGVKLIASMPFRGKLVVYLSTEEGVHKHRYIKFEVE